MNAEILDSSSSPSPKEKNFRQPIRPSSIPRRPWRTSIAVSLGLLGLTASFLIAAVSLRSHADHPSTGSTATAAVEDSKHWNSLGYVDIDGGVTPLYPLHGGRVEKIEAKENEPVKAGSPLFYLEDTEAAFKVRQAEAALKAAQEQLLVAKARVAQANEQIAAQQQAIEIAKLKVDQARIARDRQKSLEKDKLTETEAVQNAEKVLEIAKAGVRVEQQKRSIAEAAKREAEGLVATAQANIKGKQALLDEARQAVKECVVRAPVDGTPLRILVAKGETLGSNPRQPAIQFAADRPKLVRAEVEQEFVGRVRPGQSVIIEDHVTEEKCARGKVESIALWYAPRRNANSQMMSMNNDNRTLECIIHIDSTSQVIRIGQRVRVRFLD